MTTRLRWKRLAVAAALGSHWPSNSSAVSEKMSRDGPAVPAIATRSTLSPGSVRVTRSIASSGMVATKNENSSIAMKSAPESANWNGR